MTIASVKENRGPVWNLRVSLASILSLSVIPSLNLANPGEDGCDILPFTRDKPWQVASTLRSILETMGLLLPL